MKTGKKIILCCLLDEGDIQLNKEEEFWEIYLIKLDWETRGKDIYNINEVDVSLTQKPKQLQKLLQNEQDVELFRGLQTNLLINL